MRIQFYKDIISTDYIIERITNGINSCVRHMGTPIAWGITQDDGALGFLHVLPEFRKMGYARDITLDLIKKVVPKIKFPLFISGRTMRNQWGWQRVLDLRKIR